MKARPYFDVTNRTLGDTLTKILVPDPYVPTKTVGGVVEDIIVLHGNINPATSVAALKALCVFIAVPSKAAIEGGAKISIGFRETVGLDAANADKVQRDTSKRYFDATIAGYKARAAVLMKGNQTSVGDAYVMLNTSVAPVTTSDNGFAPAAGSLREAITAAVLGLDTRMFRPKSLVDAILSKVDAARYPVIDGQQPALTDPFLMILDSVNAEVMVLPISQADLNTLASNLTPDNAIQAAWANRGLDSNVGGPQRYNLFVDQDKAFDLELTISGTDPQSAGGKVKVEILGGQLPQ
jgi:hypothetical protein